MNIVKKADALSFVLIIILSTISLAEYDVSGSNVAADITSDVQNGANAISVNIAEEGFKIDHDLAVKICAKNCRIDSRVIEGLSGSWLSEVTIKAKKNDAGKYVLAEIKGVAERDTDIEVTGKKIHLQKGDNFEYASKGQTESISLSAAKTINGFLGKSCLEIGDDKICDGMFVAAFENGEITNIDLKKDTFFQHGKKDGIKAYGKKDGIKINFDEPCSEKDCIDLSYISRGKMTVNGRVVLEGNSWRYAGSNEAKTVFDVDKNTMNIIGKSTAEIKGIVHGIESGFYIRFKDGTPLSADEGGGMAFPNHGEGLPRLKVKFDKYLLDMNGNKMINYARDDKGAYSKLSRFYFDEEGIIKFEVSEDMADKYSKISELQGSVRALPFQEKTLGDGNSKGRLDERTAELAQQLSSIENYKSLNNEILKSLTANGLGSLRESSVDAYISAVQGKNRKQIETAMENYNIVNGAVVGSELKDAGISDRLIPAAEKFASYNSFRDESDLRGALSELENAKSVLDEPGDINKIYYWALKNYAYEILSESNLEDISRVAGDRNKIVSNRFLGNIVLGDFSGALNIGTGEIIGRNIDVRKLNQEARNNIDTLSMINDAMATYGISLNDIKTNNLKGKELQLYDSNGNLQAITSNELKERLNNLKFDADNDAKYIWGLPDPGSIQEMATREATATVAGFWPFPNKDNFYLPLVGAVLGRGAAVLRGADLNKILASRNKAVAIKGALAESQIGRGLSEASELILTDMNEIKAVAKGSNARTEAIRSEFKKRYFDNPEAIEAITKMSPSQLESRAKSVFGDSFVEQLPAQTKFGGLALNDKETKIIMEEITGPSKFGSEINFDWLRTRKNFLAEGQEGVVLVVPDELRARFKSVDKEAVIKILKEDVPFGHGQMGLPRQAAVLNKLSEKGFASKIYGASDTFYIAEKIDGIPMSRLSRTQKMEYKSKLNGLGDNLAELGVQLHDFGGQNLIVTSSGELKLIDIGSGTSYARNPENIAYLKEFYAKEVRSVLTGKYTAN